MNQIVVVFHENNFIFLQHRHQEMLQFFLPKLAFVEFSLHRLARGQIGGPRMKKKVSGSSTDRKGPRIFMPISAWAGIDRVRNMSKNCERLPGLVL